MFRHTVCVNPLTLQPFNPFTAGVVHIRLLLFLLAHYISAFKPVNDKK